MENTRQRKRGSWWRGRGAKPSIATADCGCRHPFAEPPSSSDEIRLDVRELSPIGQIGRTLAAAEVLGPGQRIRQISNEISWPLLAMLEEWRCSYRLVGRRDDGVHLLIWRVETGGG